VLTATVDRVQSPSNFSQSPYLLQPLRRTLKIHGRQCLSLSGSEVEIPLASNLAATRIRKLQDAIVALEASPQTELKAPPGRAACAISTSSHTDVNTADNILVLDH
jgi:hypothetical protein